MNILLGADPEFFLLKGNRPVPAYGLIPGTKDKPHKTDCGAIQVDGVAVEFNINPTNNVDEWCSNIERTMRVLRGRLNDYIFMIEPTVQFDKKEFKNLPHEATILGCDPDWNAYSRRPNRAPRIPLGFRTAAGHVHVGWTSGQSSLDPDHVETGFMMTKQLDLALHVPMMYADTANIERQNYYGAAGAMRSKPYGMEYRVLSNFWLQRKELQAWVFNQTMWAAKEFFNNNFFFKNEDDKLKVPAHWLRKMKEMGAPALPDTIAKLVPSM